MDTGKTENMTFGMAIDAMKKGLKVARFGWNGKDMWIAITPESDFNVEYAKQGHASAHRAREIGEEGKIHLQSHIDMRTADGSMQIGWLASQPDILSDDWYIVP